MLMDELIYQGVQFPIFPQANFPLPQCLKSCNFVLKKHFQLEQTELAASSKADSMSEVAHTPQYCSRRSAFKWRIKLKSSICFGVCDLICALRSLQSYQVNTFAHQPHEKDNIDQVYYPCFQSARCAVCRLAPALNLHTE